MKLTVLQENLSEALNNALRFTSSKAQLPVLGNILFSAKKTKLSVLATNLEISIAVSVGARVEKEGEITIPARVISELVSNLPAGQIELNVEKERVKISAQGFQSDLAGMNANDFPSIPQNLDKQNSIDLPKEEFSQALSQVIFSASIDETRPILTGVLFLFQKGSLTLVATDGFRLSQKKVSLGGGGKLQKVILPKSALGEISRLSQGAEKISLSYKEKDSQAVFEIGDCVLSTRILEGEFPAFEKIIPKGGGVRVGVDKEEFLRAVKTASVFARDSANIVRFTTEKGAISLNAESNQTGSQKAKVDAKVDAESKGFEIAFNYRFVEEFLHAAKGDEVTLTFSTPTAPGVFQDATDINYLHLIMPVRLQS